MTNRDERIQHYLDHMCVEVKAREVHNDLRDELGNHMEEMILDKKQEGYTEEEAIAYAIEQMGDPTVVGKSMHRLHRHRMHWGLLVGIASLLIISLLLMWIFTTNIAVKTSQFFYISHVIYTIFGLVLMVILMYFDYRKWKRNAWWIYILLTGLLWINPLVSPVNYGVQRFWSILGLTIDLTTISMWVLPLAIGSIMLDKLRTKFDVQSVSTYILLVALPSFSLFQASDWVRLFLFGTATVIMFAWITRKWIFTFIGTTIMGSVILFQLFLTGEYRRFERLSVVLNLQNDPLGNGYNNQTIMNILHSAGWWGNGSDTSFDHHFKGYYMDYPGVMLIDVFGWLAGILLLLGIVWFLASMLRMLPRVLDEFGRMIVFSITVMFSLQMLYSLAMTTGKVPIVSVTFPFIGFGSHVILEYAMMGLLLGVYRRKDTISLRSKQGEPITTMSK
ncbi:FtsW/RodA/SpoVE family cell cycle protein [Paenibacillus sp. FSL M7-0656]|uniref:FtsW/RodA/SpoVE family cell cycle protein n=1 Tax=Paenibacillus sp. FSL M7-0656 TaxID=2921534 RepID=UPI0030FCE215